MADLTRLLDTVDCAGHGCPNEADGADGLCRYCRTNGPRREPTPTEPGALAHLADQEDDPMVTPPPVPLPKPPADPVVRCRKCDQPATHLAPRGMYSRLCDRQAAQRRRRRARSVTGPVLAIAKTSSGNAKLGDCATTHAAQQSCPASCVFKDGGGCYAETGRQGMFVTRHLNAAGELVDATALQVAQAEADAIDAMQVVHGRPMRLHTVGDCSTDEAARIVSAAAERYMQRGGGPVWTYTHAWREVERASWGKVSVLASCETEIDVCDARLRGYATAIVVESFPDERLYSPPLYPTMAHLPCPSMTRDVPCSSCRLCMNDVGLRERGYSIAFEIHGIPFAKRAARIALTQPDDPDRRIPSEERVRRVRDRILAEHGREPSIREVADEIGLNTASVAEWLRYLRGETPHPSERRRAARERDRVAA